MKTVAVLGGGPAGSVAAARLADSGVKAILIDEKLAWEKPCGGGVTCKAYKEYPFLIDNDTPKRLITSSLLSEPSAGCAQLEMAQPLVIYARKDLNGMLLERAARAGAEIEKARVIDCNRDHVDIRFIKGFEGYIWVFPRLGHLSVGICGKGETAQKMRARLERYLDEEGIQYRGASFYGHMLPSLEQASWKSHRVAGDGWLAVGDSAGLVDPVTGEGIYYAVRSGDVAAATVLEQPEQKRECIYRKQLKHEFIDDLTYGAHLSKRLFCESFFGTSMTARMIQSMRKSPRLAAVVEDLFAGTQNYLTLKKRLLESAAEILPDLMLHTFFPHRTV
jgi:flavin-dependent dehydrogenase